MEKLLPVTELQERSGGKDGVSVHSWRLWIRQGKLPSVKLGSRVLVRESDYLKFIEANLRNEGK